MPASTHVPVPFLTTLVTFAPLPGLLIAAASVFAPVLVPVSVNVAGDVAELKATVAVLERLSAAFAAHEASSVPPGGPSVSVSLDVTAPPVY